MPGITLRIICCWLLLLFFIIPAPVSAAPVSKLGIFVIGPNNTDKVSTIIDACPAVLKVQDPHTYEVIRSAMQTYHDTCPDGTIIVRIYVAPTLEKYTVSFDPNSPDYPSKAAQRFWDQLSGPIQQLKDAGVFQYVDYVSGPNEYDNTPVMQGGDTQAAQWTADFWVELARLMHTAGARPILGEFPVGNIEPEHYPFLADGLQRIKNQGIDVAFSYHSYGKSYTFNAADEAYYSLRYRKFYQYLDTNHPALTSIPFYSTEVGVGLSETGFDTGSHQEELKAWLASFDAEIKNDPYIKGGTVFQIGGWADWTHRAIEGISGWLAGYINGTGEVVTIPGQPPPESSGKRCAEKGWLDSVGSLFTWVSTLFSSDVPKDIKNINAAGLPPTSGTDPDEECDDEDLSAALTAHRYNSKAAQIIPTVVPEKAASWWSSLGFGDIFSRGGDASQTWVESGRPPGTGEPAAYRGRLSSSDAVSAKSDTNVLGWFDWFSSKEERMQQGVCEKRKESLPPELCCDKEGRLFFCGSGDRQPQLPTPTPGTSDGSTTSGGYVGACLYLDEQDPDPAQASVATANLCSYQKLLPYFGNDVVRAKNASQICLAESGGNEINNNLSCLPENGGGTDYSIGLFQINLLWHCSSDLLEKFSTEGYSGPKFSARDVVQFAGSSPTNPCHVKDWDKLRACQRAMENPANNVRKAASMSGGGTNWNAWSTAKKCGLRDWKPGGTGSYTDHSLVYYSQRQPEYAGEPFDGSDCNINKGGCGIATVSMIISSLTDKKINPIELKNKYYASQSYCVSSVGEAQDAFRAEGLPNHNTIFWADPMEYGAWGALAGDTLKTEMRNNLLPGCALFTLGTINGIGHFWWIPKVDENGTIYTMDPWYGWNRSEQKPYAIPLPLEHIGAPVYFRSITRVCKQ